MLRQDGRRFEAGTINTVGVAGLTASLDLLMSLGIEDVEAEVVRLVNRLAEELERLGFAVASPRPLRSGIVGVILPASTGVP